MVITLLVIAPKLAPDIIQQLSRSEDLAHHQPNRTDNNRSFETKLFWVTTLTVS